MDAVFEEIKSLNLIDYDEDDYNNRKERFYFIFRIEFIKILLKELEKDGDFLLGFTVEPRYIQFQFLNKKAYSIITTRKQESLTFTSFASYSDSKMSITITDYSAVREVIDKLNLDIKQYKNFSDYITDTEAFIREIAYFS